LCDAGYEVSLETSGALDVSNVDQRVGIVMDLKTPGSGEGGRNLYGNLQHLALKDQVKFVLCSRSDYDWAKFKLDEYDLANVVGDVLFSPSYEDLAPVELANWIVQDRLPVRFQMQLHKQLWGDQPGR
jgi:7-carboxy-7-deazaguanine synthase